MQHLSFSSSVPGSRCQGSVHFSPGARPERFLFTLNKKPLSKKTLRLLPPASEDLLWVLPKNQLRIFHSKYLLPCLCFPGMLLGCPTFSLFARCAVSWKTAQYKSHQREARPGRTQSHNIVKGHLINLLHLRMHAKSLQLCLTLCNPMDCSCQAPLSMGFSRQEYWSG